MSDVRLYPFCTALVPVGDSLGQCGQVTYLAGRCLDHFANTGAPYPGAGFFQRQPVEGGITLTGYYEPDGRP